MKFLRPLLGITKLDKKKNQSIRKKNWGTEHSKGNKTTSKSGYNMYSGWVQTDYQSRHCAIDRKDEGTRFTSRFREQATRLATPLLNMMMMMTSSIFRLVDLWNTK
jgi:hypothetical protein